MKPSFSVIGKETGVTLNLAGVLHGWTPFPGAYGLLA